jgi:hypothetical protein
LNALEAKYERRFSELGQFIRKKGLCARFYPKMCNQIAHFVNSRASPQKHYPGQWGVQAFYEWPKWKKSKKESEPVIVFLTFPDHSFFQVPPDSQGMFSHLLHNGWLLRPTILTYGCGYPILSVN